MTLLFLKSWPLNLVLMINSLLSNIQIMSDSASEGPSSQPAELLISMGSAVVSKRHESLQVLVLEAFFVISVKSYRSWTAWVVYLYAHVMKQHANHRLTLFWKTVVFPPGPKFVTLKLIGHNYQGWTRNGEIRTAKAESWGKWKGRAQV